MCGSALYVFGNALCFKMIDGCKLLGFLLLCFWHAIGPINCIREYCLLLNLKTCLLCIYTILHWL